MRDRTAVLSAMIDQGVIPVFYHSDTEVCVKVIKACSNAGAKCIEFTNRGDFAAHQFAELTRHFAQTDESLLLGAGSIIDAPTAAMYIASGARFIVGPLLNPEVARLCNRRMILYSPGCGTATEIGDAHELGCEIIKIFPGSSVGGPDFVRSILGPMPWTKVMPTGGVDPTDSSLRAWFSAGIVACGIGSKLITSDALAANNFGTIERTVRETLALARRIRAEKK